MTPQQSAMVARLQADVAQLTRFPSRAVGTPGNLQAADYVESRFKQLGLSRVKAEEYTVTAPVTAGGKAMLSLGGRELTLYPMYPNGVAPSTTPPDGLSGKLIYAGAGRPRDYNGLDVADAIVALDFNSGMNWITAADLGARALIFLEPETTNRGEAERKFATLPVELPRFYAPRATADAIRAGARGATDATLKSRVTWETVKARNIVGVVPGTDPELGKQTIIISGYYDSMAVTPDLAPGAEAAGNCAALLETARYFKANPGKYSLMFMANGAHHLALAGVRNFAATHFIDATGKGGDKLKDEIKSYRAFVGLDLTSRTPTVGLFAKSSFYNQMTVGSENILLNLFFDFAKVMYEQHAKTLLQQRGAKIEDFYVDGVRGLEGRTWRSYLPSLVAMDSEVATMAQKPGISFATANDARNLQDTAFDTPGEMRLPNLARQVETIGLLLGAALRSGGGDAKKNDINLLPVADADNAKLSQNFGYGVGRAIYRNTKKITSFLPSDPIPNAIGHILDRWKDYKSYSGVRGAFIEKAVYTRSGVKGGLSSAQFLFLGPRIGDPKGGGTPDNEIEAYSLDSEGRVVFAPDMGSERERFWPKFNKVKQALSFKDEKTREYNVDATTICFPCRSVAFFDTLDQRYFQVLRNMSVLNGKTDSIPVEFGFASPAAPGRTGEIEPIAIVFGKPGERFKMLMAQGLLGKRLVVLQTSYEKTDPKTGQPVIDPATGQPQQAIAFEGVGVPVPEANSPGGARVRQVSYRVAQDLWTLDHQRINLLKKFGIDNQRVELLHGEAGCATGANGKFNCPTAAVALPNGGALAAAAGALDARQYDTFYREARRAFGIESRAYPDVEMTAQDVLKGIIFYLALLLPFCFFLERLLFGSPDIIKQIRGVSVAFLIAFASLRYVHPAFELALTPFIILLAFIILSLTVVVTAFLSSKFEAEIKRMKQGVHFADVGRLSALSASLGLGIANMRRRPTRTALTCVTLILLTFTVLSFTSVTASISNFARPYGEHTPAYSGMMVRQPDWGPMQEAAVNSMRSEFQQRFGPIALRAWYLSRDQGEPLQLRVNSAENPEKSFFAPALVGLTPEEASIGSPLPRTVLPGGRWFQAGDRDVCLLPKSVVTEQAPTAAQTAAGVGATTAQAGETGLPLGITLENAVGSRVQVAGQLMTVIGVFDDEQWTNRAAADGGESQPGLRDLDDEQFTPVDYQNDQNKQTTQATDLSGQKGEEAQVQRYQHMNANALLLIPYDTAIALGATTRSLAAGFGTAGAPPRVAAAGDLPAGIGNPDTGGTRPHVRPGSIGTATGAAASGAANGSATTGVAAAGADVATASSPGEAALQDLMKRAALGIFGATPDPSTGQLQTRLYSSVERTSYEGFAALVVPIVIAALIIANTMLGSVYERTREIGIYSSVGLAPIHVAALFIAEATVYAVLGSISGYLLAQAIAKVVTITGWLEGITLNYSSSAAVLSTLIVMATVLLSTLYPAWQASRMSQPDIERRWQMSVPQGDLWRFQFPFTVSGLQPLGVAQFLADFFETHTDTSIGSFYTDRVNFTALPLREASAILGDDVPIAPSLNGSAAHNGQAASAAAGVSLDGVPAGASPQRPDATAVDAPVMSLAASEAAASPAIADGLPDGGSSTDGSDDSADHDARPVRPAFVASPDTEVYHLAMRVWLAPFDMGVSQDVDILLMPSADEGLYELQLKLVRQSGEISAWKRVNRGFMSDLRRQLLLWRTIKQSGQQEYILRGRAHVTGQVVPTETPGGAVAVAA